MKAQFILTIDGLPDDTQAQLDAGLPARGLGLVGAIMAAANVEFPAEVAAGQATIDIGNGFGPIPVPVIGS